MGVDKFRRDGEIAELLVCGDGLKGRRDSLRSKWRATRLQLEGRGRHVEELAERSAARWQARVASISLGTLGRNGGVNSGPCRHRSAQVPRAKIRQLVDLSDSIIQKIAAVNILLTGMVLYSNPTLQYSNVFIHAGMNGGWCFPADEEEPLQYCTVPKEACQPRPHSQPRASGGIERYIAELYEHDDVCVHSIKASGNQCGLTGTFRSLSTHSFHTLSLPPNKIES